MNFYYDSILGLQYDYIEPFFSIDITIIPENQYSIAEYLKNINIQMINENTTNLPGVQKISFITNYKL